MRKISAIIVAIFIVTYTCFPVLTTYAQGEELTISGEYEENGNGASNTTEPVSDTILDCDDLPTPSSVPETDPQPDYTKISPEETPEPKNPDIDTKPEEIHKPTNAAKSTEPEKQEGYVYNFEDLQTWLDENENGTVNLGANITVPYGEMVRLGGYELLSVHADVYGIIVEGELWIESELAITGEGVLQPVVEVQSGGKLYIDNAALEIAPCITATGDDACALA